MGLGVREAVQFAVFCVPGTAVLVEVLKAREVPAFRGSGRGYFHDARAEDGRVPHDLRRRGDGGNGDRRWCAGFFQIHFFDDDDDD